MSQLRAEEYQSESISMGFLVNLAHIIQLLANNISWYVAKTFSIHFMWLGQYNQSANVSKDKKIVDVVVRNQFIYFGTKKKTNTFIQSKQPSPKVHQSGNGWRNSLLSIYEYTGKLEEVCPRNGLHHRYRVG